MRRLVLVVFALALLCQGAWAAYAPACVPQPCCGQSWAVSADDHARHLADDTTATADEHAPCDAAGTPCNGDCAHCQATGLTGLLHTPAGLPEASPGGVGAAAYLCHVPDHVPDNPLRPPHPRHA